MVVDVVGLHLAPPEYAVLLCVDERLQIQVLKRTATGLPMQLGHPASRTHDYVRHGTSMLLAALEIATGHVTAACKSRHRRQEVLAFLKQVARVSPGQELHLVTDNCAVHEIPEAKALLAEILRFLVHFTPTSASRLHLVKVWSGIIERQSLHRADVASAAELDKRILAFITGWNDPYHPIVWTRTSTRSSTKPTAQRLRRRTTRLLLCAGSLETPPSAHHFRCSCTRIASTRRDCPRVPQNCPLAKN